MNQKRLVCFCCHVSEHEIKKTLCAGAFTTSEIQKFTSAGTACGRCIPQIDEIIIKYTTQTTKDLQLRINF